MSKEIKSYRLLVVEDNPGDYMLLEQYLQLIICTLKKVHFTFQWFLSLGAKHISKESGKENTA